MIRIRLFEERVSELKLSGKISGPVHTCIGQEAVATGVCLALSKNDFIIGNHRSHGHLIAKGTDVRTLMADVFKGNGSSMHVTDSSIGAICTTAIVGSGLPLACGVAFANKDKTTCVFFGDGAANEGTFYESLNLASMWQLPIIFLLENNGVAVTTVTEDEFIYRCNFFNIKRNKVYGQDVDEVYLATRRAINNGPWLIEAKTMRFREHQEGHAYELMKTTGYRDNTEVDRWISTQDPIKLYCDKQKIENLDDIYSYERELIDEAVEFAEKTHNNMI